MLSPASHRNSVFVGLIFILLDDIQLDTSSIQLIFSLLDDIQLDTSSIQLIFSLLDDIQLDTSSIQLITRVARLSVSHGLHKNESCQSAANQ